MTSAMFFKKKIANFAPVLDTHLDAIDIVGN